MKEKNSEKKERKMRDSGIPWIGEVPEWWGMSPLKYNYNIIAGATPDSTKQSFWDGNIKWITPADYKTKDVYVSLGKRNLTPAGYKACSTHMLPKGSIVISKRAPIGSVAITTSDLCTNQGCLGLVAKNKFVNNKYFYYVLSIYDDVLNLYGSGTTFKEISANVFSNIEFPLPSVTIQNSIADFLDSKCFEIDTLIENLHTRVKSAKEYKKAVITEAVTKGLDKNAKMKDSGVEWIGEIPEGWKVARLKQVLKTPMKYGASESGVEYSDELPRYIRITDITLDNKLKDTGKLSLTEQQAIGYLLSEKTVLFARSGATVGKTFLYKPEYGRAAFAGYMISAIPNNNKIKAEWLYYYTLSQAYWDWVNSSFSQATIQNIGADKYSNLPIVIPSLITQQQVIDYLDSKCSEIDALLQNYEDQIATLEEYKKSLIYEYVTGKKEVPAA